MAPYVIVNNFRRENKDLGIKQMCLQNERERNLGSRNSLRHHLCLLLAQRVLHASQAKNVKLVQDKCMLNKSIF